MNNNKKIKKDRKINKLVVAFLSVIIALIGISPLAYADDAGLYYSKDQMTEKAIISGFMILSTTNGNYTPDLHSYPNSTQSIGFNTLFGTLDKTSRYYGEIPQWLGQSDSEWGNYRHYNSTSINGKNRSWGQTNHSGSSGSQDIEIGKTNTGIFNGTVWHEWSKDSDSTKDIHAMNMLKDSNIIYPFIDTVGTALFSFFYLIYYMTNGITSVIINIAGFSPGVIYEALPVQQLTEIFSTLFLKGDNGFSPIFIVSVILFIIGLILLIAKYLLGRSGSSAQKIFEEIGILCLAMILCGVSLSGGLTSITTTLKDASISLCSAVSGVNGGTTELYNYDTGRDEDLPNTQTALSQKPFIDFVIQKEFGYPVKELYLTGENWGLSDQQISDIVSSLNSVGNTDRELAVSNKSGVIGSLKDDNLGYYWYASLSGVNPSNPFRIDSDGVVVNYNTPGLNSLFVYDFLAAVDKSVADNVDPGGSAKAKSIMSKMYEPGSDAGTLFFLILLNIFMALAISTAAVFTLFGKIIFMCGVVVIPVTPILLMIPNPGVRKTAQGLAKTWLIAGVKMIIGGLFITLTLTVSSILLQEVSPLTIIIDIIFLFLMFKAGPKLFILINESIGRHELAPMRNINRGMNNAFSKINNNRKGRVNNALKAVRDMNKKKAQKTNAENSLESAEKNTESNMQLIEDELNDTVTNDKNNYDAVSGQGKGILSETEKLQLLENKEAASDKMKKADSMSSIEFAEYAQKQYQEGNLEFDSHKDITEEEIKLARQYEERMAEEDAKRVRDNSGVRGVVKALSGSSSTVRNLQELSRGIIGTKQDNGTYTGGSKLAGTVREATDLVTGNNEALAKQKEAFNKIEARREEYKKKVTESTVARINEMRNKQNNENTSGDNKPQIIKININNLE